jgi:molecular chaperone GrpE
MTDYTARRPGNVPQEPEAQGAGTGMPQTEEAKIAELVETLAKENAEHKDRLLRTLAEMENLRKRTEREVSDMRQYGIASFARDVLAVADNMERALGALDAE